MNLAVLSVDPLFALLLGRALKLFHNDDGRVECAIGQSLPAFNDSSLTSRFWNEMADRREGI